MIDNYTKLRVRREYRQRKKIAVAIGDSTSQKVDKHIVRRLSRFGNVQRFVGGWLLLIFLMIIGLSLQWRSLGAYYLQRKAVAGGTYIEGETGVFTNANPLYAVGALDTSVSRLLFSSLFTYDNSGKLVGDLAARYEVDEKRTTYTVTLKDNIKWHDGVALTADDVVFTYKTIQNPDARSPLNLSWHGVKISVKDQKTVVFVLPSALSGFVYSMTNGIVPKHLLAAKPIVQLRSDSFNSSAPIGSGPFEWSSIVTSGSNKEDLEQIISLKKYNYYHRGPAKLDQFVIHSYPTEMKLENALINNTVQGAIGLGNIPEKLPNKDDYSKIHSLPLSSSVMVFMKNSSEILKDVKVRRALTQMTNVNLVINSLGFNARKVDSPLLRTQIGYNSGASTVQLPFDLAAANKLLDEAGYIRDQADGMRKKDGKVLEFTITSQSDPEYSNVINELQKEWRVVGIKLNANLQPSDAIEQSFIVPHNYDLLLYGISIGTDPDVFAYWHSTQADPRSSSRLNLSEWVSPTADQALEAGRTRLDPDLRTIKYKPFLEAWHNDAPAIGLYQPRVLYVTNQQIFGFTEHQILSSADRLNNVNDWMILEKDFVKQPAPTQ